MKIGSVEILVSFFDQIFFILAVKTFVEAVITKNHETKAKNNLYNFKGPGPGKFNKGSHDLNQVNMLILIETPQDAEEVVSVDEKILDSVSTHIVTAGKEILVGVIGEPHYCDSKGSPLCQVRKFF